MTTRSDKKLMKLLEKHRPGTVCLASWMEEQGISRDLQQYYRRSGWLEPIGHGAYKRPGDRVDWQGGAYALVEQAGLAVHVGGMTALSHFGNAQYLKFGSETVYLFSPLGTKLPAWFKNYDWGVCIEHVRTDFLPKDAGIGEARRMALDGSQGVIQTRISDTERAMLECLYLAPKKQDLVECYQVMEGLTNLRPKVVQGLLEDCASVKVKRLFLYMAEKAGHKWYEFIDQSRIKLGSGDRSLVPDGVYIAKHHISVPKELAAQ